jgi:hypothetical protein
MISIVAAHAHIMTAICHGVARLRQHNNNNMDRRFILTATFWGSFDFLSFIILLISSICGQEYGQKSFVVS